MMSASFATINDKDAVSHLVYRNGDNVVCLGFGCNVYAYNNPLKGQLRGGSEFNRYPLY